MRNFTILSPDQRSDEWRRVRCGRLTASDAKHMLATIKSGEAATRRNLRVRLAIERITGMPEEEGFVSAEMRRGIELEPDALAAYEAVAGIPARTCGFVAHNDLQIGCSPDAVIGDFEGGVEVKVPNQATHLGYLRARSLPAEHSAQIIHSLFVTGAEYWDFCSYDPRFPEPIQTFLVRTRRQDVDLKAHELAVSIFLREVDQEVDAVRALMSEVA